MNIFHSKIKTKKSATFSRGMTYVELIVVLGIFTAVSSSVIFSYRKFEDKVDMKVLANDVALKLVQAQKDSLSGRIPLNKTPSNPATWKPSYGVYFANPVTTNTSFILFTDLNQDKLGATILCTGECMSKVEISKGIKVSSLSVVNIGGAVVTPPDLSISFTRPDSSATFKSGSTTYTNADYAQITFISPQGLTSNVKVYQSGRMQIN